MKVIFARIPRTGSTALFRALRRDLNTPVSGPRCIAYFKHSPLYLTQSLCSPEGYKEAYKFSVVRNPYEQIYSWFLFSSFYPSSFSPSHACMYDCSFEEWVLEKKLLTSFKVKKDIDIFKQTDFLRYKDKKPGDRNWIAADDVFYYSREGMDTVYRTVCEKLNIKNISGLDFIYKTNTENYLNYYTNEMKRYIIQRYTDEFEYLGFNKDTGDKDAGNGWI